MDMIYLTNPMLLVFPLSLLAWQILSHFLRRKLTDSHPLWWILTGIGVVGHAAAIGVILLSGGELYDVLVLVLLTGFVSALLCPKPRAKGDDK